MYEMMSPELFIRETSLKVEVRFFCRLRARIVGVTASRETDPVAVHLTDEVTGEIYKRVTGRALVALPPSIRHLATAGLHFIEGLLPYETFVGKPTAKIIFPHF